MSKRRYKQEENIYSSACIQALEQQYCSSCSAAVVNSCLVSSHGLGARVMSRIYHGGRQAVYTATVGAMLVQNMALPAYANKVVSPGQTLANYTANGERIDVKSSGKTVNLTLDSDSREIVSGGGSAHITTINSGGSQQLQNARATSTTIFFGGYQRLEDSEALYTTINGGLQVLYHNGTVASDTIINAGGQQQAFQNTSAIDTIINSGGLQDVREAALISNTTVNSGGEQRMSAGRVHNTTINFSGVQNVSGGSAISTTVDNGGEQYVFGGSAISTTVSSGGAQTIFNGGTAKETIISGGSQEVASGGFAIETTLSGGAQNILAGGLAQDTDIVAGTQTISSGGVASNAMMSGGKQVILSDGLASRTTILATASQVVSAGGTAQNALVSSAGSQIVWGQADNTEIFTGGSQTVFSGAVANNTTINSGGSQFVYFSGIASNTTISSGGVQNVSAGSAISATVNSGGQQYISSLGEASNTTINSGGYQSISSDGWAGGTVVNAHGSQTVSSGGVASNTTVNSGGVLDVASGGRSYNTVQNFGGGIVMNVFGGDTDTYISGTNENGDTMLLASGVASNFVLNGSGRQDIVSGGLASNTTINSGALQMVSEGGIANSTTIDTNGAQTVFAGGIVSNTAINSGGIQNVSSGGNANDTQISGGVQNVFSGATVSDTTLYADGIENIYSGGLAKNTVVSGCSVNLYEGGGLSGYTGYSGDLNVYGNGTITGNISLASAAGVHMKDGSAAQTLTMENLSASGATFHMNVDLEQQTADKLNITNSYAGQSLLQFTNVAPTAQLDDGNGVKVVEFGNSATINGTFELPGGQWDEGGYVYKLYQGDVYGMGDDYYLRNTKALSNMFKTVLNIPVINAVVAQAGMNSLQRRLGDLRAMNNPDAKQGVWVRSYYKDMTVNDLAKTDLNLFGAEAGYDWLFRADEPTKLYAGVLVGFVAANSIKTENNNEMYDKGDGEAPGVGVYATLVNEEGWFVDLAARNFWTKLDMKNHAADGREFVYKPSRNVLAASVEVGKNFESELARNRFIRIEPKVEVGYMNAEASTTEVKDTAYKIKYDGANYVSAKAGVLLSYNAIRSNGLLIEPLLEFAYRYDFAGKNKVSYGNAEAESDLKGGTAEINAGLNMQLTDNLYWYGLGTYEASDKVKGWGVHAGIRYAFGDKSAE